MATDFGNVKIPMIKMVRQLTGFGLRESKNLVEYMAGSEEERSAADQTIRTFNEGYNRALKLAAKCSIPEAELIKKVDELETANALYASQVSEARTRIENFQRTRDSLESANRLLDRQLDALREENEELKRALGGDVETLKDIVIQIATGHLEVGYRNLLDLISRQPHVKSQDARCSRCMHKNVPSSEWPCCSCEDHGRFEKYSDPEDIPF